jgi:hypothetical protein
MFKLTITECRGNPPEWEWRICDVNTHQQVRVGWKITREKAEREGESALFNLEWIGDLGD